jgi:hypothetical protein
MKHLKTLSMAIAAAFFSSCNDNETVLTTEFLLTEAAKGWITTSLTVTPALGGTTDLYSQFQNCDRDDATVFKSATNYQIENTIKCQATEQFIPESGTWILSSDKKVIQFKPSNGNPYEFFIVKLSFTELIATIVQNYNGTNYTFKVTMKPK